MILTDIIEQEIPNCRAAVLSGPSHAEEVGRGLPTTVVAGAHDRKTAEFIQNIFMNQVFRVYTSPDMLGIELGGALKNVIALAAGIADGLVRHRRSHRNLRFCPQPEPEGRIPDGAGQDHAGGHGRGKDGSGGRVLRKGGDGAGT